MITIGKLKKLISSLPDDAEVIAYEGEDTGLTVTMKDGSHKFIRACDTSEEDEQPEFPETD